MFKYQATGNDFVIVKDYQGDLSELAKRACNRHYGVGADGFINLHQISLNELKWEFYNQDGSKASMCGNGARAAFAFARDVGMIDSHASLSTEAGVINGWCLENNLIKIQLAKPSILKVLTPNQMLLNTGVPHLVLIDEKVDELKAKQLREEFDANVNFVNFQDDRLHVDTYERGVGWTLACGTGLCASAIAWGIKQGVLCLENKALIGEFAIDLLPTSKELVNVQICNEELFLTAEAKKVFECDFK